MTFPPTFHFLELSENPHGNLRTAGSLGAAACAEKGERSGLTVVLCDPGTPPLTGSCGEGAKVLSSSAGCGSQNVEATPGPADIDSCHVLGPQPSKEEPLR